jgi:hypothetical protein
LHVYNSSFSSSPVPAVNDIQFCLDDKHVLASVDAAGTLNLWDTNTSAIIQSYEELHHSSIRAIRCAPSMSSWICTGGLDKKLCFVDRNSQMLSQQIDVEAPVTSLDFSANGINVAVGTSNGFIRLYDIRKSDVCLESFYAHSSPIQSIQFSTAITAVPATGLQTSAPSAKYIIDSLSTSSSAPISASNSSSFIAASISSTASFSSSAVVGTFTPRAVADSKSSWTSTTSAIPFVDHNLGVNQTGQSRSGNHNNSLQQTSSAQSRSSGSNGYPSAEINSKSHLTSEPWPSQSNFPSQRVHLSGSHSNSNTEQNQSVIPALSHIEVMPKALGVPVTNLVPFVSTPLESKTTHDVAIVNTVSFKPDQLSSTSPLAFSSSDAGSNAENKVSNTSHLQNMNSQETISSKNNPASSRASNMQDIYLPINNSNNADVTSSASPEMHFKSSSIQQLVDESMFALKQDIKQDINNLHLEIVRQFHVQNVEFNSSMQTFAAKFESLINEVKELRDEYKHLKHLY